MSINVPPLTLEELRAWEASLKNNVTTLSTEAHAARSQAKALTLTADTLTERIERKQRELADIHSQINALKESA